MRKILAEAWEELMRLEGRNPMSFRRFQRDFRFYQGNAQHVLLGMEDASVDFAYFDPSWFSYTKNAFKITSSWKSKNNAEKKLIESVESRFSDTHAGYLAWFRPVLRQMLLKLKDRGVIAIHLSTEIAPYFRQEMDEIFGRRNLLNELIWCFTSSTGEKGTLNAKHDTILIYAKNKGKHFFNEDVRRYYHGSEKTTRQLDWWDEIPKPSSEAGFYRRGSRNEIVPGMRNQKPIHLLVRLIQTFCARDGVVLDLFNGSGTTALATYLANLSAEPFMVTEDPEEGAIVIPEAKYNAQISSRKFFGGDIDRRSLDLTRRKFKQVFDLDLSIKKNQIAEVEFDPRNSRRVAWKTLVNSGNDYHMMAEILIGSVLGGLPNPVKVGDEGVDGWLDDGTPVQVKMSEGVGSGQIRNFFGTSDVQRERKGLFLARSFSEQAIRHCKIMQAHHKTSVRLLQIVEHRGAIDLVEIYPRKGSYLRRAG